jgi:glycosyltransferase involved in cell wall biosynthesis
MRSVFLVHSLRKGGAERLLLELASSVPGCCITVISWVDNMEFLEEEYANVKVVSLLKEDEYYWLKSLRSSAKKLDEILNSIYPSQITIFSHSVFWLMAFVKFKTQYIYVIQGFSQLSVGKRHKKLIYRCVDRFVFRKLRAWIITPTEDLSKLARKYFCVNRNRIKVIPSGVDVGDRRVSHVKGDGGPTITMLGTVSRHKGQHLAVEIIEKLRPKLPSIELNIIGDGPLRYDLSEIVKKKQLQDHINLLGRRADAFDLLSSSDLFLHLSLSEGMPLAVIEAMMCGLPVVAFNVRGVRDVVTDNGYLCDYGNLEDIAKRILELARNRDLRNNMSKKSMDVARKQYGKTKMIHEYASFFEWISEQ